MAVKMERERERERERELQQKARTVCCVASNCLSRKQSLLADLPKPESSDKCLLVIFLLDVTITLYYFFNALTLLVGSVGRQWACRKTACWDNSNNTHDNVYSAVIMTTCHCESSLGSFDECRTAPSSQRPSDQAT